MNSDDDSAPYQRLRNDLDIKEKVEIGIQFRHRVLGDPRARPDQDIDGLDVLDTLEETITAVEATIADLTERKFSPYGLISLARR